jgi:hypothetical protein
MLRYNQRVKTVLGPGTVDARIVGKEDVYLVSYGRSNFAPDKWLELSPGNGPSVFRQHHISELEPVVETFPVLNTHRPKAASWHEVVVGAERVMKTKPQRLERGPGEAKKVEAFVGDISLGQFYASKKKGDIFEVIDIMSNGLVKLSWTAGKYKRDVEKRTLLSHYVKVETATPPPEEVLFEMEKES